jgi:DUF4097 and DUF4098 domain-containing protein YvlB
MNRITAAVFVTSLAVLCSCDDFEGFGRVQQDFHYSYAMKPGGHLDIENRNGSISMIGWDRDTIDVSGTKYAPDDGALKEVHIKVDVNGGSASISTESPGEWGNFGASYTIHLPRNTSVSRAKSTNGSITAEELNAGGTLATTNGHVNLRHTAGDYQIRSTNGSIEFENCSGRERAETTNGPVRGTLQAGAFDVHTVNGTVELTVEKPAPDQDLRASTTNGPVRLELNQFAGNAIHLQTTHGSVTLRLPHDTNARLEAHTSLSRISTEFPIASEESDRHDLRGQLGKGGPVISVSTSTGAIRIEDGGH